MVLSRPAPDVALVWATQPVTRRAHHLHTAVCATLAVALGVGGDRRLTGVAPATLVQATGGSWVWAALWLSTAAALVCTAWSGRRAVRRALLTAAVLHLAWAISTAALAFGGSSPWLTAVLFAGFAVQLVAWAEVYRPTPRTGVSGG